MKHFSSLLFTLCLVSIVGFAWAQNPSPKISYWDSPEFDERFCKRNKIKSIQVSSFMDAKLAQFAKALRYEYDNEGRLLRMVETQKKDTARIHGFAYTDNGTPISKVVTDKVWDKNYKSWYRFNRMGKVYQEKSYELLRNNETMLLQTRQYIYNADSQLTDIRVMENNRLVHVQHYEYDERGRVTVEVFQTPTEKKIKSIGYVYDDKNRLTRIATDKNGQISEYIYVYNNFGQPMEVQWRENGDLVGTVTYKYDTKGVLTRMERSVKNEAEGDKVFVRLFEYEHYSPTQNALSTN